MTVPAFEDYVPAVDCACGGCAAQRRAAAAGLPTRLGGHPAAHGARRALVLVTAAGVVLSAGLAEAAGVAADPAPGTDPAPVPGAAAPAAPFPDDPQDAADPADPGPESPQGGPGPLQGAGASGSSDSGTSTPALRTTSRADIINRAKKWVTAQVPYSMSKYWSDGYRQDCSGYVSMAWNLAGNEWTGSLAAYGTRIAREELQPGDILLFHNPADPTKGSHVTIFGGWTDYTHTHYTAYEQTSPHTRKQTTPMAYWTNSGNYVAYRYKGLTAGAGGSGSTTTAFPGAGKFGPGANNAYVTQLGKLLVGRGGKRFYKVGPGPAWSSADRLATQAFQQAQGWKGKEADGIPGPDTWSLLVKGTGHDIPAAGATGQGGSTAVPAFPGRGYFRSGQSNSHVDRLGKQLVKKGYGKYYLSGPGPRWTEADRRNVEAFQKAQGWRGTEADGYPGPETWRRLFA
ncbi:peptidoglycan-binding protein [Streptomyces sp. RKAG290]|uniref:peptidoglycan-binding protein n=1 Tax=Streptomyces sp. RKAG290 TaxID=2888348 RepID=UPI002033C8D5|nr:peptidoglycan-binding protein [Streptomyces sp. RKAG290]MCM2413935.1 peptidoglycan-binding protein [Streptomyces sp. RKAG290]